jgi:hypothetical protein
MDLLGGDPVKRLRSRDFGNLLYPGAPGAGKLPKSPFQVSRSRGGRYACRQSGIFFMRRTFLAGAWSHRDLLLPSTIPFPGSREAVKQQKYD